LRGFGRTHCATGSDLSSFEEPMTDSIVVRDNLTTLGKHLRAQQLGGLAEVIEAIALAGKAIARKVQRARIDDVIGVAGAVNVQGEVQQKLDVLSDALLLECLRACPSCAVYASEEQEKPVVLRTRSAGGEYVVLADPLDGSSNIDVAVSVGTIFSVLRNTAADAATADSVLQKGDAQVAAGYVLYGTSVLLVLATSRGTDMYAFDPGIGEFVIVKQKMTMPAESKTYSINEAYVNDFAGGLRAYLEYAHGAGYGARYIGSMVADVHRTLLKGGVFIYPGTKKAPKGKLRLMYECNPMAFVLERAGGAGSTGAQRILEVVPSGLHDRVPAILGSAKEVEQVTRHG
jgi:fructose-1,6-bisphosphatase I